MKKTLNSAGFLAICAIAVLFTALLPSCTKNEAADARGLLATVPSDASMVAVINIKAIIDDTGSKVDGAKVDPSKQLSEAIAEVSDPKKAERLKALLDGKSGVDLSCAIIFMEGMDVYAHGNLADPEAFKTMVESESGEKFTTADGVESCGNTAVDGNRFWIRLSHRNSIEPNIVKRFTGLDQSQSILSGSGIESLADTGHDIAGWANAAALINASPAGFSQKAMTRMAVEALFADAQSLNFTADFDKGEFETELSVLNSKGKAAKFLYPLEKVDTKTIADANVSGSMVIAAAISKKAIAKFQKDAGENSVSMMKEYARLLGCLDGTCVIVSDDKGGVSGRLSTTGENTLGLQQMLNSFGFSTNLNGKALFLSKGTPTGSLSTAEAAPLFKGAAAGMVIDGNMMGTGNAKLKSFSFMLVPDDGSVKIEIKTLSSDSGQNFLLTLLESAV